MDSLKGIFSEKIGPVPVWLIAVAGGAVIVFLIRRYSSSQGTQSSTDAGSSQGSNPSAVGLAVDPTTGLPYAVEGLVPSGAMAGQYYSPMGQQASQADFAALQAEIAQLRAQNQPVTPTTPTTPTGSTSGGTAPATQTPVTIQPPSRPITPYIPPSNSSARAPVRPFVATVKPKAKTTKQRATVETKKQVAQHKAVNAARVEAADTKYTVGIIPGGNPGSRR